MATRAAKHREGKVHTMWETTLQFEQRALTMMRTGRATRKNRDMSYRKPDASLRGSSVTPTAQAHCGAWMQHRT